MANKRRDGIRGRINSDSSTTYRAQVRIRGFVPVSKSFTRRTDAKRWIEETKTAMRDGTFVVPLKKGKKREADRVKTWMKHPLALRFISHLRGADFAEYRDKRRAEGKFAIETAMRQVKLLALTSSPQVLDLEQRIVHLKT